MKQLALFICVAITSSSLLAQAPVASESFDVDLAKQGVAFMKSYCKRCHGDSQKHPGLDVSNRATLLKPNVPSEAPFLVEGKPDSSRLWEQVSTNSMPPQGNPQPTDDEKATFRRWIESGAHFPPEVRPGREFRGEETVLAAIDADLRNQPTEAVPYTRYFSLAHLWNDTRGKEPTTDADLRQLRAALSKLVNSLSSKSRIVVPRVVDPEFGTVLAIDMRNYGWDEWHWNEVLKSYPYALKVSSQSATKIYQVTQTRVPYLRADWFVAVAARPPLYHTLLNIPQNAKALEKSLGVEIFENFQKGQLARAAFQKSGVSAQNRLLERHYTREAGRYYWKSYDMKPTTSETGDFTRRPLGPIFEQLGNQQLAAFKHDGGEIIWSLANRLQAYMLVTGTDDRIDVGPIDVVFDPNGHSGSPAIVNGISCMGCHKHGMFAWEKEDIRPLFENKRGQVVADKVLELYLPNEKMQKLVQDDRNQFLAALKEATASFLQVAEDADKPLEAFPDPITQVANRYLLDVTLETAARELGLPSVDSIKTTGQLRVFRDMGLANWSNVEGTVPRETWEVAYGRMARELNIGVPIRVR